MTTLRIEHAIVDFALWKSAFDRFAEVREQSGVLRHRIHRAVDDPAYVFIDLDFATATEAEGFLQFLRQRVWSSPQAAPALVGTPVTRIVEPVSEP